MPYPNEAEALQAISTLFSEWLGTIAPRLESTKAGADWTAKWKGRTFVFEYKRAGDAAAIAAAIEQLSAYAKSAGKRAVPVLVVPYMGDVGQRLCEEAGVHWLDLSGNASIRADALVIEVRGNENRFKRRGRPSSAFFPKAARIARQLLIHVERPLLQKELAEAAGLDSGYTSKVVRRLEGDGLLLRDAESRVQTKDPALLLDAWSEHYVRLSNA